jgi:hypothetical protein
LSCCFLPLARPIVELHAALRVVQVQRHERVAASARPCRSASDLLRVSRSLRERVGSGFTCVEAVATRSRACR